VSLTAPCAASSLVGFRRALTMLGITVDDRMVVALFARYDLKRRGFIDYHEFIAHLMEKDFISRSELSHVATTVKALVAFLKAEGSFANLRSDSDKADIHTLTDDEFMARQRLKAIFHSLDKDESGFLDFSEFNRMLKLIGCVISPVEVQAIWDYVDENGSGSISFDEFYEFYTSTPPPPSSAASQVSGLY
jgi:Ca2+-binding EF-hand superfamily protein